MSTWISKAVLLSLCLSGCVMPDGTAGVSQSKNVVRQTLGLDGVTMVGPSGYCPVPVTQQRVSGADFVAFAPCNGGTGAILAATLGAEGSAEGITLKRTTMGPYFATEQGMAALRGAGNQDQISLHEVDDYKGAVVLRLTRQNQGKPSDSWRALMQIKGRLVTLSVRPRQGMTVGKPDGRRLIARFVDAMRGANGA
jgi:hypothetical protein